MQDLYSKNLDALKSVNLSLYEKLQEIHTNKEFEVFVEKDNVNVLDINRELWVCKSDSQEYLAKQDGLIKYREYPFLYFFGLGNGFVIENLLKNSKHKQIIVIEPDIEMVYIAMNFIDVSTDFLSKRFVIILQEEFTFLKAIEVFHSANARFYTKMFMLHGISSYYLEARYEDYKKVFGIFLETIEHIIKAFGNDVKDSLLGLKHHIKNLPRMVSHPKFSELCKGKNSNLAVIVSTGPSLHKQLETLKLVSDYVTIISVDASFPVLCKYGIKPDIVVSMERDEPTSSFFVETTLEEQENVVFLCASLQHESVFHAIKGGQLLIVMRPFDYNSYFDLNDYGYISSGMSSANMAHELASQMGFETCAFIGQDLAYGADGNSHSKGHVFGADQIKDGIDSGDNDAHYQTIELLAYGSKGTVESMMFWEIFLRFIEQNIEQTKLFMTTINATEGGVHIRGSVEQPFEEVVSMYKLPEKKQKIVLHEPNKDDIELGQVEVKQKVKSIIMGTEELQKQIQKSFLIIAAECKVFENIEIDEALEILDIGKTVYLLEEISLIRKQIEENSLYTGFISSIAQALLFNEEFKLAKIKVRYVDNPAENKLKALQWILGHRYWLFALSGVLENIIYIVKEESKEYV